MAEQSPNPRGKGPTIGAEEATEANLCAYLEGTLPPAERAQIEAYLVANPQHRNLLNELATTRQWLTALPRQPAPPEIAETFQQQMERSMLLDDMDASSEGTTPLNRWPQRLLIAALVLLAAGLGLVVYLALPANGPTATKLAGNMASPAAGLPQPPFPPLQAPAMLAGPVVRSPTTTPGPLAMSMSPAASAVMTPAMVAAPVTQPSSLAMQSTLAASSAEFSSLSPTGAQARWVVISTSTTQPAAMAERIRSFLDANQVAYGAGQSSRAGLPPQLALSNVEMNQASGMASNSQQTATTQQLSTATVFAGGSQVDPSQSLSANFAGQRQSTQVGEAGNAFMAQNAPADLPARLRAALLQQFPHDRITLTDQPASLIGGDRNAATMPGDRLEAPLSAGQMLTVTVDQLAGPGIEKTNSLRVGGDGTIALPMMIEPLPAAGKTPAQLEQAIAQRYRDASLIANPTVHVSAASQPAQAVAELADRSRGSVIASQPAQQEAADKAAQRVDLLVVIESAVGPTSQPATAAATMP
jgi:hypothetical protein